MYKKFILSFMLVVYSVAFSFHLRAPSHYPYPEKEYNLNLSSFMPLRNYQVSAIPASEAEYPWVARVLHSRRHSIPHMCTAACVEERIFATAAICLLHLKLRYTSVIYQDFRLHPKAFVIPSNRSQQMYDDIGFIIITDDREVKWKTIELIREKRSDDYYYWFNSMTFDDFEHKVIGYAMFKNKDRHRKWKRPYHLTQLNVHVSMNICPHIMASAHNFAGFGVPCYYACTLDQFKKLNFPYDINDGSICNNYHGSEGSALVNLKTNRLMGIATWGAYYDKYEMPVGFSIPNSVNFYEDLACAKLIRDDEVLNNTSGYYQSLCDSRQFEGTQNL